MGLVIAPENYSMVYKRFVMMGDKFTHRYAGLVALVIGAIKHAAPIFVVISVTAIITNMIWAGSRHKGFRTGLMRQWPFPKGICKHYDRAFKVFSV